MLSLEGEEAVDPSLGVPGPLFPGAVALSLGIPGAA